MKTIIYFGLFIFTPYSLAEMRYEIVDTNNEVKTFTVDPSKYQSFKIIGNVTCGIAPFEKGATIVTGIICDHGNTNQMILFSCTDGINSEQRIDFAMPNKDPKKVKKSHVTFKCEN